MTESVIVHVLKEIKEYARIDFRFPVPALALVRVVIPKQGPLPKLKQL